MRGLFLAAAAVLAVGCVTVVAPPATSPGIVPAPTTAPVVTAAPVATRTFDVYATQPPAWHPSDPPVRTAQPAGTPWMTYLSWGLNANTENQSMLTRLQGASDVADMVYLAGVAYDQQDEQDRWLDSHPPMACYRVTWDAHQRMVHSLKAAFDAIRSGRLTSALDLMDKALTDTRAHTASIDLATC